MSTPNTNQNIDITQLPIPQLSQLQTRLSQDLEHLSTSHAKLRGAQARFRDCLRSIDSSSSGSSDATPLLVPLTSSLYVPAHPSPCPQTFLIDIGTGYFISKTPTQAQTYYAAKVKDLGENMAGIERVVRVKSGDLRVVEEVLRGKVLEGQMRQTQQQQQQGKTEG